MRFIVTFVYFFNRIFLTCMIKCSQIFFFFSPIIIQKKKKIFSKISPTLVSMFLVHAPFPKTLYYCSYSLNCNLEMLKSIEGRTKLVLKDRSYRFEIANVCQKKIMYCYFEIEIKQLIFYF